MYQNVIIFTKQIIVCLKWGGGGRGGYDDESWVSQENDSFHKPRRRLYEKVYWNCCAKAMLSAYGLLRAHVDNIFR